MAKLWQLLKGHQKPSQRHPRPAFSEKVLRVDQGKFFKNNQKVALVWKAQKHSGADNIILYLVCTSSAKTAKDFGAKSGSKSARMAKLWQFSQGHPKAPFSEKVQRGGLRKIFQKSPKKWPSPQKPNSTLAQMALSSNYYAVKVQRLERILAQNAAPKVPEWPRYSNFCKVTQNPHLLKKWKGGARQVFQKSPKK